MQRDYLKVLGVIFVLIGITAIVNSVYNNRYEEIFFYCYIALLINGLGLIKKNSFIIMSQMNITFIPFLFWNIDFFYHITTGSRLWGITDYYFTSRSVIDDFITFQHIFTLPILFYALHKIRILRKDAWKLSFVISVAIFALTRIFTSPINNINCVYRPCITLLHVGVYYPAVWLIGSFLTIIVANYVIVSLFTRKEKKYF